MPAAAGRAGVIDTRAEALPGAGTGGGRRADVLFARIVDSLSECAPAWDPDDVLWRTRRVAP